MRRERGKSKTQRKRGRMRPIRSNNLRQVNLGARDIRFDADLVPFCGRTELLRLLADHLLIANRLGRFCRGLHRFGVVSDTLRKEEVTLGSVVRAGGLMLVGTDSPLDNVATALHLGLRAQVKFGLAPWQALQTATIVPPRPSASPPIWVPSKLGNSRTWRSLPEIHCRILRILPRFTAL